jgi:hypothetical protein
MPAKIFQRRHGHEDLATSAVGALLLVAIASPSQADDSGFVRWKKIIGVAQAGDVVGDPPNTVTGGGQPWSTLDGDVVVNLNEGSVYFEVRGLVLAGGNSIGTPDKVTNVLGTLLCGLMLGETTAVISTPAVPLSAQGNAEFFGSFSSSTTGCSAADVAFLLVANAANGPWIGNGAVRVP